MFRKKIIVKIDGMKCEHCSKRVCDSLKKIDNVKSVKVSLENKNAAINYKDNVDIEQISQVIENEGFHFVGVES